MLTPIRAQTAPSGLRRGALLLALAPGPDHRPRG
jgi:hypothetical protein